jgi:hypothetical protein
MGETPNPVSTSATETLPRCTSSSAIRRRRSSGSSEAEALMGVSYHVATFVRVLI